MAHAIKFTIMKKIKIITHPVTLILCFFLILISGEHLGGFYLLYILLGLLFASPFNIFSGIPFHACPVICMRLF